MPSSAELRVALGLRAVLSPLDDGAAIEDSVRLRDVEHALEYFIPATLSELYPEWRHESLDGFCFHLARKAGDLEAELFGLCIIISDQTLTPVHLRLQVSDRADEVSWLECRLGEAGPDGMVRATWSNQPKERFRLENMTPDDIAWVYRITFGRRRPSPAG